jgi:replication factor A1
MSSKQQMIARILKARPEVTITMIEESISKKKVEAGGLLTDEGAVYMVANDLGIDLSKEKVMKTRMTISDLLLGTSDATITGTVLAVYPVRSFQRKNGREGKVVRVVLGDITGIVNVVLWDEQAEIAEHRLKPEAVIRINHGYVRAGLDGKPELNVGRRGSVVIIPPNLRDDPSFVAKETYKKIRNIDENDHYVSLTGRVELISAISRFYRKNGREGQVARIQLADDSGRIVLVFWDEQTEVIERLRSNNVIKIVNGQVRNDGQHLEIHVRREAKITVFDEHPDEISESTSEWCKITSLIPGMVDINVLARVMIVGQMHEFIRSSGETGKVREVFLMDETGWIRLTLWNEKTSELDKLTRNDVVLVEGAYTREGPRGVDLNLDKMGNLRVNPLLKEADSLPMYSVTFSSIDTLRIGLNVSVKGTLSSTPDVKTVVTKDGRELRVASVQIQDNTGEVRASFWRSLAEKFEGSKVGSEIIVQNAYVKKGFSDEVELTSRSITEVEITPPTILKTNETSNTLESHMT